MSDSTMTRTDAALWLDDQPVSTAEVMAVLRKERKLPELVRNLVLDRTLSEVKLTPEREATLISEFREQKKLLSDEAFADFLQKPHHKTPTARNSQPATSSIAIPGRTLGTQSQLPVFKHKDRYDRINYRRLQSGSADVMQEVFFRLKDKEDSWESMARQFPGAPSNADALQKRVPAVDIEERLLATLRKAGPGVIIRPLQLNPTTVVVAELESIEASRFDEELRYLILRREFESWLQEECSKMINNLQLPA